MKFFTGGRLLGLFLLFSFNLFAQEKEKFLPVQSEKYANINGNSMNSIQPENIHAYVFPTENANPRWYYIYDLPEDKRKLAEQDEVYMDEVSFGIFMHGWPCGDYIGKNWIFEFTSPDGIVTKLTIEYGSFFWGERYWEWRVNDGSTFTYIDEAYHCLLANLWYAYDLGLFKKSQCSFDKVGNWVLKFIYSGNVMKIWNIEVRNIDRGWLWMSEPVASILPDGLEIEGIGEGGDSTNLNVIFKTCDGPQRNQSISFEQQFINNTGGHNHDEPQICQSSRTQPYCGIITPETVTTGSNGQADFQFTAPYYSGKVEIKARTNYKDYEREAKRQINVLVPGLQRLSGSMVLVPDNENCVHGDYNNYYNPNAMLNFQTLASEWLSSDSNPQEQALRFTAGSLPWGGKFDDGICWSNHNSGNHQWHRYGRDADIATLYPNGSYMNQSAFLTFIRQSFLTGRLRLQVIHFDGAHTHVRYIP